MRRAHVIGAGLAGLGAAIALARGGFRVNLSDGAAQAGGRCRSYHDPQLDMTIDNGNHLVLSGNRAVHAYLDAIGAADRLAGPESARFAFADVGSGQRWLLRPNAGRIPWWITRRDRRVPGTTAGDYLPLLKLARAPAGARVSDVIATSGPLWERLLEPFLLAALNTPAAEGSAALAGAVIAETLAKGGRAYRPRIASPSLAAAFVDPALDRLAKERATVRLGRRLRALGMGDDRIHSLHFSDGVEVVGRDEPVVLAVPPWIAASLLPGLVVPDRHHAIVNAHFALAPPPGVEPIVGLIGGTAEWLFAFPDRLSVTVSAADALCEEDRETLARRLWEEVARVHNLPDALPRWQIVRERRATFAATPDQDARRPDAETEWRNLFLAGDWTQTGLPATIEGALRSGERAAALAMVMRGADVAR